MPEEIVRREKYGQGRGDFLYDDGRLKIYAVVYNENEYNFQVYVDNRLREATDIVETLSEAMDLFAELIDKYKD